jgi:hypothetical protein
MQRGSRIMLVAIVFVAGRMGMIGFAMAMMMLVFTIRSGMMRADEFVARTLPMLRRMPMRCMQQQQREDAQRARQHRLPLLMKKP